jgi:hypothetical protein
MNSATSLRIALSPGFLSKGEIPVLHCDSVPEGAVKIYWHIFHVEKDFTIWCLSAEAPIQKIREDSYRAECQQIAGLDVGFYVVGRLEFRDVEDKTILDLTLDDSDPCLFEVQATPMARTDEGLRHSYFEILENRKKELTRGVGEGPESFSIFIFFKDCLIKSPFVLGRYELGPCEALGGESIEGFFRKFFTRVGAVNVQVDPEMLKDIELKQPAAVIHFPVIHAADFDSAMQLALKEAALLVALVSMHREGSGTIFASAGFDRKNHILRYGTHIPSYRGNLIGGLFSGEHPRLIKTQMDVLRKSEAAQLYVQLYREALIERNQEFQYAKFWTVLETMARSKDYIGKPKYDAAGKITHNRKQQPVLISDTAQELVTELIRDSFTRADKTGAGRTQELEALATILPVWYRRRNCITHGSECLCRLPERDINKNLNNKYIKCKEIRDENISRGYDFCLGQLRDTTKKVLMYEIEYLSTAQ